MIMSDNEYYVKKETMATSLRLLIGPPTKKLSPHEIGTKKLFFMEQYFLISFVFKS